MKEQIILNITQEMLPYLDNAQLLQLQKVLEYNLRNVEMTETSNIAEVTDMSNMELLTAFINAKRIEGCSEKTLKYYQSTISKMLSDTEKHITHITTDDLRKYLAEYQKQNTFECGKMPENVPCVSTTAKYGCCLIEWKISKKELFS